MNESKFTDLVLDATSDYIAKTVLSENDFSVKDCIAFVSESTDFDEESIEESFGELIADEINRAIVVRAAGIIESNAEKFSNTLLLKEDDVGDVSNNADNDVGDVSNNADNDVGDVSNNADNDVGDVSNNADNAAKNQGNDTNDASAVQAQQAHDQQKKGSHNRKYFAYVNLAKGGQVYICSERQEESGMISNAFAKLGNFLKTITSPQIKYGILAAPINEQEATSYLAASKNMKPGIKYLDLTKNTTGAENAVRQNQNAADAAIKKAATDQQQKEN